MSLSILLTTYNRPALTRQAIESVLAQSSPDWELLIGDDNSSSAISDWLQSYARDGKVLYFNSRVAEEVRANTCRFSTVINALAPLATGSHLCYLCDDNEYHPDFVKTVLEFFNSNPQALVGYVPQRICRVDWHTGETLAQTGIRFADEVLVERASYICDHNQVVHAKHLFHPWDEDIKAWKIGDGWFWDSLINAGHKFYPIPAPEPLVIYKEHDTNVCRLDVPEILAKLREEGAVPC